MIFCNFNGMNFVALFQANVLEDQLTILFNLLIVEYPVSILRHQHDVVSDLTIAMAKTAQFQCYHILAIGGWHHLWLKCREHLHLKEVMYYRFKRARKTCEGSLHLRPKGRSIRDPPRSQCNKFLWYVKEMEWRYNNRDNNLFDLLIKYMLWADN
jgi:hypothetical protein